MNPDPEACVSFVEHLLEDVEQALAHHQDKGMTAMPPALVSVNINILREWRNRCKRALGLLPIDKPSKPVLRIPWYSYMNRLQGWDRDAMLAYALRATKAELQVVQELFGELPLEVQAMGHGYAAIEGSCAIDLGTLGVDDTPLEAALRNFVQAVFLVFADIHLNWPSERRVNAGFAQPVRGIPYCYGGEDIWQAAKRAYGTMAWVDTQRRYTENETKMGNPGKTFEDYDFAGWVQTRRGDPFFAVYMVK